MLQTLFEKYRDSMYPVVPFEAKKEKLAFLDLSGSNTELTPEIFEDTQLFTAFIENLLLADGAKYGIGGYLENRKVYARSEVFNAVAQHGEARSVHLGTDIWGKAGTPIMAPLDGIVHSTGNHPEYGNYGATIILQHQLESTIFYTLYGHLSLADLIISPGTLIKAGQVFAHFGAASENGHWPPHLHFQIIGNLQGCIDDYPGVCAPSQRFYYERNCPDPAGILKW
jgi:murein DD-endopeptidase MepM/ murein hydrolase activator NlpD